MKNMNLLDEAMRAVYQRDDKKLAQVVASMEKCLDDVKALDDMDLYEYIDEIFEFMEKRQDWENMGWRTHALRDGMYIVNHILWEDARQLKLIHINTVTGDTSGKTFYLTGNKPVMITKILKWIENVD